tara:strand:- start:1463 stop:2044 length:582 start_codon:yes stop_codon:yes gene_type:complete
MKNWSRDEIDKLISRNDKAVEKAIIRLFKSSAFHDRDVEAGTHFAQWLLGMNGRSKVVYPSKELSHPRAIKRFGKMCLFSESPIDRARRIALLHSEILTVMANEQVSKSPYEQVPLPFNTSTSDEEYADILPEEDDGQIDQNEYDDDMDTITVMETDGKPWTWADTARLMAQNDDSGFDWDRWKDEMKERDME